MPGSQRDDEQPQELNLAEILAQADAITRKGATIEVLNLHVRTYNCLKRANLRFVQQLIGLPDAYFLALPHFDSTCLLDLREQLKAFGV